MTKPLFSEKSKSNKKIILLENDNIISEDPKVAEIFNDFFAKTVETLRGIIERLRNVKNTITITLTVA